VAGFFRIVLVTAFPSRPQRVRTMLLSNDFNFNITAGIPLRAADQYEVLYDSNNIEHNVSAESLLKAATSSATVSSTGVQVRAPPLSTAVRQPPALERKG
jgi:hypothetical protein